jgi:hypothetical protein
MISTPEQKPCLWDKKYIIDNLPPWIYSDSEEPNNIAECKAKISSIEYTIRDIELQIEIRELELKTGSSRHQSSFDFEKWKTQALRAKQTHLYLLNAYKYWGILNDPKESPDLKGKLKDLVELLVEEPSDFVPKLECILNDL